jgi:tetratricopeptide (TPR) repeat protein
VDLHRFRRLVARAERRPRLGDTGRPAVGAMPDEPRLDDRERVGLLREALSLWRGTPLAGLSGTWVEQVRRGCEESRVEALLAWARAELRLGDHAVVIGPLYDTIAEHPLVEPLTETLMRALYAAGRVAAALDCYTRVRERLADELGVDPGPELRRLHQAILRGELDRPGPAPAPATSGQPATISGQPATISDEPATASGATAATVSGGTAATASGAAVARGGTVPGGTAAPVRPSSGEVPAQLPADVYGFTGRERQLERLDSALRAAAEQPTAAVILALWGTAGVGKTALAVHWAHRVADRFPDGQLHVNLRGFDPAGSAMEPAEAVRGFLDAFGVPAGRVPAGLEAQVGLYRSLLSGRRVLVVLDNARDAEQVRPLLPGSPGCVTVVTSRNQLPGLVAVEGARPVTVDLLPAGEARELLARRAGSERVASEPETVDEIIEACARLPLALAIVAARAATYPEFPLAALAEELTRARGGLDAFAGGDPAADVRGVFSWSYRTLGADAARLFRLLALHPGPDVTVDAAASLAGVPARRAAALLAELGRAHLAAEHAPGRYALHDLLRAYAAELAEAGEPVPARRAAAGRMYDHYLHTARRAATLLTPHLDLPVPPPAREGTAPTELTDHERAMAWMTAELPALLAVLAQAGGADDGYVAPLARTLENFFQRRGHWHDWAVTQQAALRAARRRGDREAQAAAHRGVGRAFTRMARYAEAQAHYDQALTLYAELGDRIGEAHTRRNLALAYGLQERPADALHHAERALALYRLAGNRAGEANTLNNVGWYHARLGEYDIALDRCGAALRMLEELGDRSGQAHSWDSLGYVRHHLGDHAEAVRCFRRALDLFRELGDRDTEAETLTHLGDAFHAAGDHDAARAAWQRALEILDELGKPGASTRMSLSAAHGRAGHLTPG